MVLVSRPLVQPVLMMVRVRRSWGSWFAIQSPAAGCVGVAVGIAVCLSFGAVRGRSAVRGWCGDFFADSQDFSGAVRPLCNWLER